MHNHRTPVGALPVSSQHSSVRTFGTIPSRGNRQSSPSLQSAPVRDARVLLTGRQAPLLIQLRPVPHGMPCLDLLPHSLQVLPPQTTSFVSLELISGFASNSNPRVRFSATMPAHTAMLNSRGELEAAWIARPSNVLACGVVLGHHRVNASCQCF